MGDALRARRRARSSAWIAKRCRLKARARAYRVRAHADVRRPGGPAWRRSGGFSSTVWPSALPCSSSSCDQPGRVPCGRTSGVSPLCRSTKSLHRRPTVGVFMTARASLAELSAPEGAESLNRSNAPRGPRWAVGSRASRSQYLCAAMMPRARRATPEVRQPVATLRGSFTQAGRPRPWSSSQGSKLKTRP